MIVNIRLVQSGGSTFTPDHVMSFTFEKDIFTPYTRLTAEFRCASASAPTDCCGIKLILDGKTVHFGIADTYRIVHEGGYEHGVLSSRGFTSMLTENQMPPGLYTDMTVNRLFDTYFTLPNITHENNERSSYIFVKRGSSMWDGAANLSYKLCGRYPYISGANKVMMSLPEEPKSFTYSSSEIISYSCGFDTRRLASHFHMENMSGEYGSYDLTENEALSRNIVRHRYFELDRRFLSDPDLACSYRNMLAKGSCRRKTVKYHFYKGEDLYDIVTGGGINEQPVSAIKITGNSKGIFTEITAYENQ